jgi:hypothetical protein
MVLYDIIDGIGNILNPRLPDKFCLPPQNFGVEAASIAKTTRKIH